MSIGLFSARPPAQTTRFTGTPYASIRSMIMQIYADVTGRTMQVAGSGQACALGAAVSAAVLAGAFRDFPAAQKAMTSVKPVQYKPGPSARKTYDRLYRLYMGVHDAFGGVNKSADLSRVMKELLEIKQHASK